MNHNKTITLAMITTALLLICGPVAADIIVNIRGNIVSTCTSGGAPADLIYDDLDISEAQGKSKAVNVNVTCSGASRVRFSLSNGSTHLPLVPSGRAEIKVNGMRLTGPGNTYSTDLEAAANIVEISSLLDGNDPVAGPLVLGNFSASGTILMEII